MRSYDRGNIILVEFVFSEGSNSKQRPALVISVEDYQRNREELILAAVTSNVERELIGDTELKDWKKAGLLYPSLVTAIVRTIKKNMVNCRLGRLSNEDLRAVEGNLRQVMGL